MSFFKRYSLLVALSLAIIASCFLLFWLQLSIAAESFVSGTLLTPAPMFNYFGSAEYAANLAEQAAATDNVEFAATICHSGIVNGYAAFVIAACERAVELEPQNAYFHDFRGIARMMNEDFASAESDFHLYVTWLRQQNLYDTQFGAERDAWLSAIKAGRDPLLDCRGWIIEAPECVTFFREIVVTPLDL